MSAKVNSFIYPYTEQVRNLPVFLTGIGGTEYQKKQQEAFPFFLNMIFETVGRFKIQR